MRNITAAATETTVTLRMAAAPRTAASATVFTPPLDVAGRVGALMEDLPPGLPVKTETKSYTSLQSRKTMKFHHRNFNDF